MDEKKTVVLGITGSIAAYKACEIARRLVKTGVTVKTVMTEAAAKFITPLTLETITGQPVTTHLFDSKSDKTLHHLSLSDEASLILIAPATANIIAKAAQGIADDMLSTTVLAADCPVVIAPAMNEKMYLNSATQDNVTTLKKRQFIFVGPEEGELACGEGIGRLAPIDDIIKVTLTELDTGDELKGKTVLVTSGPTQESFDPVRFVSNLSSGKMGYAIANEARRRGAHTVLVSGPTNLYPPRDVDFISVRTAREMEEAVFKIFDRTHAVVMTAAVADFRPKDYSNEKLAKNKDLDLELIRNPDILMKMGEQKKKQVLIGFAAESGDEIKRARKKLDQKNLDLILSTNILEDDSGLRKDNIRMKAIAASGEVDELPLMSKSNAARAVLDKLTKLMD